MEHTARRRAIIAVIAICAGLSIAADPGPQTSGTSGSCVGGYAYVTVLGTPYGPTQHGCYLPTSCTAGPITAGPAFLGDNFVRVHYSIVVSQPANAGELTCYLPL